MTEQILLIFSSGITLGCIYALVALGFVIVYSMTRIFNLAAGIFVMLGAFLAITFYEAGFPLILSIVLALISNCAVAAVIWMAFLYHPYSTAASSWTLLLIVATVAIVLMGISYIIWGTAPRSLPTFSNFELIIAGVFIPNQAVWIWGGTVLAVACLFLMLNHTLLGKAFRACAERPLAAKIVGINPKH